MDLRELKKLVEDRSFLKSSLQTWYELFKNSEDSLSLSNYKIYFKQNTIELYSRVGRYSRPDETALLRYLIDTIDDVKIIAQAYILSLKIPFLEELLASYESVPVKIETTSVEPQPLISDTPKSKKKGNQLTTKQQMILLDKLGIFNLSVLSRMTTIHKAAILANLLNRSEQEIRSMITYWQNPIAPTDYDCSQPKDHEVVMEFLANNNLLP